MSNEREQLIARLRRFAVVLEARGETYDAETCEQAIASLSAPVAERGQPFALYAAPPVEQKAEPCNCRIGECESKPGKLCRMTVELKTGGQQ